MLGLDVKDVTNRSKVAKAYKKMALENHPDKGGNKDDFYKITEAYDRLKNITIPKNLLEKNDENKEKRSIEEERLAPESDKTENLIDLTTEPKKSGPQEGKIENEELPGVSSKKKKQVLDAETSKN